MVLNTGEGDEKTDLAVPDGDVGCSSPADAREDMQLRLVFASWSEAIAVLDDATTTIGMELNSALVQEEVIAPAVVQILLAERETRILRMLT